VNLSSVARVLPAMTSLLRAMPLICGLLLSAPAFGQTGPAGHWEGSVQLPDRDMQIVIDLAKDDKGVWIGTFAQTTQNVRNVPLADLKVDGKSVKFKIGSSGPNAPDVDCTLENPNSLNCTLTGAGGSVPVPLKRTGDAKVELPSASPAVSAELEGNWEGSLDTPNGVLKIVVHFKNQDKSVKGTLDSPDQGANDLALTDIVQKGSAVEFQLRVVSGSFKGTLNKESTQIAGEWSQGGGTLPLTLKKSPLK
jgi:hypothetical protein